MVWSLPDARRFATHIRASSMNLAYLFQSLGVWKLLGQKEITASRKHVMSISGQARILRAVAAATSPSAGDKEIPACSWFLLQEHGASGSSWRREGFEKSIAANCSHRSACGLVCVCVCARLNTLQMSLKRCGPLRCIVVMAAVAGLYTNSKDLPLPARQRLARHPRLECWEAVLSSSSIGAWMCRLAGHFETPAFTSACPGWQRTWKLLIEMNYSDYSTEVRMAENVKTSHRNYSAEVHRAVCWFGCCSLEREVEREKGHLLKTRDNFWRRHATALCCLQAAHTARTLNRRQEAACAGALQQTELALSLVSLQHYRWAKQHSYCVRATSCSGHGGAEEMGQRMSELVAPRREKPNFLS